MTSATIWTHEDLLSNLETVVELEVWRVVEAQHLIATAGIVDDLSEQTLLEDILEATKPPMPDGVDGLPFLLATPFRYRAVDGATTNDRGSRFRSSGSSDGVFYCSGDPDTCAYEAAFYKALFFSEAPGLEPPAGVGLPYSAFSTTITSTKVLNLTTHPKLSQFADLWEDPSNYSVCQRLADDARNVGVDVIAYRSVRDPARRLNYAVLTPNAFASRKENNRRSWQFLFRADVIFMFCESPKTALSLFQEQLASDPRLAKDVADIRMFSAE